MQPLTGKGVEIAGVDVAVSVEVCGVTVGGRYKGCSGRSWLEEGLAEGFYPLEHVVYVDDAVGVDIGKEKVAWPICGFNSPSKGIGFDGAGWGGTR